MSLGILENNCYPVSLKACSLPSTTVSVTKTQAGTHGRLCSCLQAIQVQLWHSYSLCI